jgi:hypothetical protein
LFARAQTEYLNRHWFEAESLLAEVLKRRPSDVDAHLMMATLLRHTARVDEARQWLERLGRTDGGEKWAVEVGREQELLDCLESGGPAGT